MSSENSAENNQLNSVRAQGIDDASSDEELAQLTLNNRAEATAVVTGVGVGGAVASNYVRPILIFVSYIVCSGMMAGVCSTYLQNS